MKCERLSPKTVEAPQFALPIFPLEIGDEVAGDCFGSVRYGSFAGFNRFGYAEVETEAGRVAYRPEEVARL